MGYAQGNVYSVRFSGASGDSQSPPARCSFGLGVKLLAEHGEWGRGPN